MVWWRNGIIYQIYPRSFADSNGDGVGDLNGIRSRLDYLASLGIDAIWLSPVYPSPNVDFGYDVSDYTAIHPEYGSLEDFDSLVQEAHARGIRVVMDLVLNHTSDQHVWFQESRKSLTNPYRDWYLWRAPGQGGGPPNNWQSVFGGPGWELDSRTGQYYFHMFYKEQPDLNWRNPAVREAILNVFRFWLDRGVDGFRLDVFNAYFKHPDLLDNPPALGLRGFERQRHIYDMDQPDMHPLLQEVRALLDSYPERYMVGETFLSTGAKAASYMGADQLHAAFNFEFLNIPWRPRKILETIQRWEHRIGSQDWPNFVLNNHDVSRSASRLRELPWWLWQDDARMKVAAALLLTLRGTPFLYYGEEIGMRDIPIASKEEVRDPVGKKYWPVYKGRDGCRSPMQWSAEAHAGFCPPHARPWLPVHAGYATRNAQGQLADPHSLLNFYRSLIALRRSSPALQEGMFLPLTHGTRFILAYLRQTRDQTVLVVLNFSRLRQRFVLGNQLLHSNWRLLLSTHRDQLPTLLRGNLMPLEPNEALLLEMTSQ